jgi:hypothetical protein
LISAIIASTGTREQLAACLSSVVPQCARASVQLIVARGMSASELAELSATHRDITLIAVDGAPTERALRAAAMADAAGDIVAIANDTAVLPADWIATLVARSPTSATSGESNRPSGKGRARRSGPSPRVTPSGPHPRVTPP